MSMVIDADLPRMLGSDYTEGLESLHTRLLDICLGNDVSTPARQQPVQLACGEPVPPRYRTRCCSVPPLINLT